MARSTPRWVIGAAAFAALCLSLPGVWTLLAPDVPSLACVAALAIVAAIAVSTDVTAIPVRDLTRLSHAWDREPDELTRQSDPSAAGHSRPRAPDHC